MMDDFTLYQWLVLGLLSLIAFLIWAVGTGISSDLNHHIERLEGALADLREVPDGEHFTDF